MEDDRLARRKRCVITAAIMSKMLFESVVFEVSSESDSDDSDDEAVEIELRRRMQLRGNLQKPARAEDYVELVVPRFTSTQFREHFRMTPNTFEILERRLNPILSATRGRPTVPVRKQLLAVLWLLATPDSYRSVGDRFDMGKSSLSNSFMKVVTALDNLSADVIKWPRNDELERVRVEFNRNTELRGIIGAIDGTHIQIKAPKEDAEYYKTYKKTFAITLQAVSDAEMRFTDTFAGLSGRIGDLRVLRNSDLWRDVHANQQVYFPRDEYIIGDKAYPVLPWCIPPFIDRGQLTDAQKNFNRALSAKRSIIERAFALLKGRFRRLKFLDMNKDVMIPSTILACTVLHNICLDGVVDNVEDFIEEGREEERDMEGQDGVRLPNDITGEAKRDYLCALLHG